MPSNFKCVRPLDKQTKNPKSKLIANIIIAVISVITITIILIHKSQHIALQLPKMDNILTENLLLTSRFRKQRDVDEITGR